MWHTRLQTPLLAYGYERGGVFCVGNLRAREHYVVFICLSVCRRVFFFFWMARLLLGVDTPEGPPTPKTPLPVPPLDKKGNDSAPF